jgi:hypothetical protein
MSTPKETGMDRDADLSLGSDVEDVRGAKPVGRRKLAARGTKFCYGRGRPNKSRARARETPTVDFGVQSKISQVAFTYKVPHSILTSS